MGEENKSIGLIVEALTKKVDELNKRIAELEAKTNIVPDVFNFQMKFDQLVDETCKVISITREELLARRRTRHAVLGRQIISYIAVRHMAMATTEIARRINRDHSSIIHLKNTFSDYLDAEYEMETKYYQAVLNAISK